MSADRTAEASSLSRAVRRRLSVEEVSVAGTSGPFDVSLAVAVDVERRHLVLAVDVGQGLDGRAETADPGAGQVADGKALVDQRLAALEIDAVMDGDLQVGGIDLGQL